MALPAEGKCPHCKEKPEAPHDRKPPDSPKPCPGKCPCQNYSLTPAIPDGAGLEARALVQFNWLPAAPAFDTVFALHLTLPEIERQSPYHTRPPPLSGVELLHRLHILVC